MNANEQKIVRMAQELLLDLPDRASITPAIIQEHIDQALGMFRFRQPDWGEDVANPVVLEELIRRFSLWIGQDAALRNDQDHIDWLVAARKQPWRYWPRYRLWLEKRISFTAVDALDRSTDQTLGLLEDPEREGIWDRRGLVVGHVQSGKTSHYTGLICKAADAGYKIIIVLAGLHNNLRSQTQIRLDEGFLGYETGHAAGEVIKVVGAGELDTDLKIRPNFATTRLDRGDFNLRFAQNLGISPEQRPWLFVVKKNKTILTHLLRWLRSHVADAQDQETGRKVVTHLPLLLIDDEADHASVDTGHQIFDEDGRPDQQHEPTAINRLVRRILHTFHQSAYVGYTATPFANIFIHDQGETREEGPDLFPASFIINLAAPSNYVGPARVFGLRIGDVREAGLPLVREVTDYATGDGSRGWMPTRHKTGHLPRHDGQDVLPPSLIEAIDAFLLSCTVRQLRGQSRDHASMLIHVTRFTGVQREVARQVTEHLRHLRQRFQRQIDHQALMWAEDFVPTRAGLADDLADGLGALPDWTAVLQALPEVIADVQTRTINGTAKDALDYVAHQETGLKVIAIGGDKLARGLTLEGLTVSYFLRASRMYDTLMQMGRWFGYRPDYLDVCRLYTSGDLIEWFGHITDASEELREEFDLMAESGGTPRDYGLRVQSHPVLMVTSPLKMRTAKSLMLSFSGQLLETVALYREPVALLANLNAAKRLVEAMGEPDEVDPERCRDGKPDKWKGFLWRQVPAVEIMDFLQSYQTHRAAYKVNSSMLVEFIRNMTQFGELTQWTVVLMGVGTGEEYEFMPSIRICMSKRSGDPQITDRYSIGRLLDPKDEAIDLDEAEWRVALALTRAARKADPARLQENREPDMPNGPAIRRIRGFGMDNLPAHRERGLLLLYALDPAKADIGLSDDTPPVIAFGVSFPASDSGVKVEYKVNNILWEQEYGAAE